MKNESSALRTLTPEQAALLSALLEKRPNVRPVGGRSEWGPECFSLVAGGEMAVWFDDGRSTGVFMR